MRIDAHQHFIDYTPEQYPWIGDVQQTLKRKFLPDDLKPLLDAAGFDGVIAVQARQSLMETEWLLQLAEQHDWIQGVVGWVDLCSTDVERQLASLTLAGNNKLKGVRHVIQDEPDDNFMLREDFQRGISMLSGFGLAYDLLIYEKHLPNAIKLADAFPEQRFVVDHLAKPNIKKKSIEEWKRNIASLAERPNVYGKLSGLATEADWHAWMEEDFAAYLDVAFEAFGSERLMVGSDWPVCTLSCDYESALNIYIHYIDGMPQQEKEDVLGGNCAKFYGIGKQQK